MSDNFEEIVTQMMEFASCDRVTAITHLAAANHNLELALRNYFDGVNVETNEPRVRERSAAPNNRFFLPLWELMTLPIRLPLVFVFGLLERFYSTVFGNRPAIVEPTNRALIPISKARFHELVEVMRANGRPLMVYVINNDTTKLEQFHENEDLKNYLADRFAGYNLHAIAPESLIGLTKGYRIVTQRKYHLPNTVHCYKYDIQNDRLKLLFATVPSSSESLLRHARAVFQDENDDVNLVDHVQNRILADRELMREQNAEYERAREIDRANFAARRRQAEEEAERAREEEERELLREQALQELQQYKIQARELEEERRERMAGGTFKARIRYPDGSTTLFNYDETAKTTDLFHHILANPGFDELFEAFLVSKRQVLPIAPEKAQMLANVLGNPFEERHIDSEQLLSDLGLHPAGESISISSW